MAREWLLGRSRSRRIPVRVLTPSFINQVINYNSQTGAVKAKQTRQGYSDSSTWARGEAWALHGYARSAFSLQALYKLLTLSCSVPVHEARALP